ncbi:MAG: GIY-YIG nuclease family protein [Flavobacteriaceae bacterium]|nr:GIY-YIG nuclease family protein [Flavobacteriaceae bacterium]
MSAATMEKKINSTWKKVAIEVSAPSHILNSFITTNSELPTFYHLIKTHKNGPTLKIRPIVSNINSPSTKIVWLLTKILKPLLSGVSAHLENSMELIEEIRDLTLEDRRIHNYPFSLDVVALYTSIPPQHAIEVINDKLTSNRDLCKPLKPEHVKSLLEVILSNTYFKFQGQIYKQVAGLAMGSSVSGILAICVMDRLETGALAASQNIKLYKRYVDDTFILTTSREEAENILQLLNAQRPDIQFEIEHPTNNQISLLDFSVLINPDGTVSFSFYKKAAKRDLFPNYSSSIPTNSKINIARNEIKRIEDRCTSNPDKHRYLQQLDDILKRNGYPQQAINRIKNVKYNRRRETHNETETFYFEFPFIDDSTDKKIRNVFRSAKLPVKIYRRSYTLRHALKKKQLSTNNCSLESCYIANNDMCFRRNVVYELKCSACSKTYIGSTTRQLHTRIKEHHSRENSSAYKHRLHCNGNFSTVILAREPDSTKLRLKEAILIKAHNPEINSRAERDFLSSLLF